MSTHVSDTTNATRRSVSYEIVLVAYRSRDLVERMLAELPDELPVVIVDNAHDEDGLSVVAAGRPNTRYLDGPGRGFAAGANLGVRTSEHAIFIIANPDSSPTVSQIDALVADLDSDQRPVAVSSNTVLPNGRIEIGVGGWEPSVRRAAVHAVGLHKVFPDAGLWSAPAPGRDVELDWTSGVCMAMRRDAFLELGGFDEQYFVYGEDVAFGRTIREAGLHQTVRTDILVPHLGGSSGDGKTRMLQHRGAAMTRYVRQYNPPRVVWGIRAALTLGYLPRWVLARARGRAGLAAEHAAYVVGLWRGEPAAS